MLPDTYLFDEALGLWRRPQSREFAYTDGDVVEEKIRQIVRDCSDPSVFSEELAEAVNDWPSLYHLGRGRMNLLRPFLGVFSGSTLEIGCGCGAITRALGELGGEVLALEGSASRAEIAASRCRGLPNVTVVHDSFDQFEHAERFDVVTLIGVLEYARKYFKVEPGRDAIVEMIARARTFLRPGGILLVAIENQLGLKYFAGHPEDHNNVPMYGVEDCYGASDVVTFGEVELRRMIDQVGFREQQWWYPFPDYKFPISIFSESGVKSTSCDLTPLLQNSVVVDPQRSPTSFSLESAWSPVFRNGLAGSLANSFVLLASDLPLPDSGEKVLAYHYASSRREEYAKQVVFVEREGGDVVVRHKPLFNVIDASEQRSLRIEFEETGFVSGRHWQKELVRILNRTGWSLKELEAWAAAWFHAFLKHTHLDHETALSKNTPVSGDHFDAVPRNLIIQRDGSAVFIDQEWHLAESCPLGFIVFRSLGLSFFGITSVAKPEEVCTLKLQEILLFLSDAIGIDLSGDDLPGYVQQENALQALVATHSQTELTSELLSDWQLNVRLTGWNPETQYLLEAEISRKDQELGLLAEEVHRLEAVVIDKAEAIVIQAKEIQRLENFAEEKQRVVGQLCEDVTQLNQILALKEACSSKQASEMDARIDALTAELAEFTRRTDEERHYFYAEVAKRDQLLDAAAGQLEQVRTELQRTAYELRAVKQTRWFRLREVLLFHPFGFRKVIHLSCIVGAGLIPRKLRSFIVPKLARMLGFSTSPLVTIAESSGAYQVRLPPAPPENAQKIVHVIANFMTGGSSRLVVDLVEGLGSTYRQAVLTSFNPDPPAYVGVEIEECRFPDSSKPFEEYFRRVQPNIVHVHYWGDCDEAWYAKAIEAARLLDLPVVENINTPIEPYKSEAVVKYVYVSDYVRSVFGEVDSRHVTVYPGSDFKLFTRKKDDHAPDDCVGMVYRLERDKLNEEAILPFIRIVQMRPQTRILIVGGGSLLEPFRAAAQAAGVVDNFEFTDYVSYDALPDLYRRMSLFVAPVWKESFGQVSPFAMSMKVPVIGYDVGAIGEIIGNPELVAPAADAESLARIAVRLLNAPEQRRAIGETQKKRAEDRFSVQAMIDHYAQHYAEITLNARKEPV